MALRRWIKKLERRAGTHSFVMRDSTVYRYDFEEASGHLFCYCIQLWTAEEDTRPPEPEILQAIRNARDPVAAISRFRADDPERGFVDPLMLLEDGPRDVA